MNSVVNGLTEEVGVAVIKCGDQTKRNESSNSWTTSKILSLERRNFGNIKKDQRGKKDTMSGIKGTREGHQQRP